MNLSLLSKRSQCKCSMCAKSGAWNKMKTLPRVVVSETKMRMGSKTTQHCKVLQIANIGPIAPKTAGKLSLQAVGRKKIKKVAGVSSPTPLSEPCVLGMNMLKQC